MPLINRLLATLKPLCFGKAVSVLLWAALFSSGVTHAALNTTLDEPATLVANEIAGSLQARAMVTAALPNHNNATIEFSDETVNLETTSSSELDITIINTGVNDLANVSVTLELPDSVVAVIANSPDYTITENPDGTWQVVFANPLTSGQSQTVSLDLSALPDVEAGSGTLSVSLQGNGANIASRELAIRITNEANGLFLTDDVDRDLIYHDEVLTYRLGVSSQYEVGNIDNVVIRDVLPVGMRYMAGTAKLNGNPVADPAIGNNGRHLTFPVGTLGPEETATIEYMVYVSAATPEGKSISPASASGDGATSNDARAITVVRADPINRDSHVVGQVMANACEVVPEKVGELDMSMSSELQGSDIRYHIRIANREAMLEQFHVLLDLPPSLELDRDSIRRNGDNFTQWSEKNGQFIFEIGQMPPGSDQLITFIARGKPGKIGQFDTMAMGSYRLHGEEQRRTELLVNSFERVARDQKVRRYSHWVRFDSLKASLSGKALSDLEGFAGNLGEKTVEKVYIFGHADERNIRARSQDKYSNNTVLSEARAEKVSEVINRYLALDEETIIRLGKGSTSPLPYDDIEDRNTANRRVEVIVETNEQRKGTDTQITKAQASSNRREVIGTRKLGVASSLDRKATGLEGVRLIMEDGRFVETDEQGRYHFEGLKPGTHVIQIDPESIPEGFEPYLCESNTRFAQNPSSQFVEVSQGLIWRANFHLRPTDQEETDVSLKMKTATNGEELVFRFAVKMPQPDARLKVALAEGLEADLDSVRVAGESVKVTQTENLIDIPLKASSGQYEVLLSTQVTKEEEGDLRSEAWLTIGGQTSQRVNTQLSIRPSSISDERYPMDIAFEENSASVGKEMALQLNDLAFLLKDEQVYRLEVTGTGANESMASERATVLAEQLSPVFSDTEIVKKTEINQGPSRIVAFTGEPERHWRREVTKPESIELNDRFTIGESKALVEANKTEVKEAQPDGILNIRDGERLADNSTAVRIQLDARLKMELTRDGEVVPSQKVGFQSVDQESNKALYTFFGVDLGDRGEHTMTVKGIGPFGNARFEQTVNYIRTGEVDKIVLVESDGNMADGKTPVRAKLKLLDKQGNAVNTALGLEVVGGSLRPYREKGDAGVDFLEDSNELLQVERDGSVLFDPVNEAGLYRVNVRYNEVEEELKLYVKPYYRDWVMVGLAEGTVGRNDLSGNMQELEANDLNEKTYEDGKVAFYAKGQIKGKYLLTMAFDSSKERQEDERLLQLINPDDYYTLYGDNTEQQFDAASREKLYIRFDADRFYALFGDFNTEMTQTELSRYSRSFTGARAVYESERFSLNSFAAETAEAYQRDEIRGNGTSGLYRLSRGNVVANSEKIRIEVRDRFNPQQVISEEPLARFSDYSIDYQDGSVYFKKPIAANAEGFNPVFIVAEYETRSLSQEDIVAGGRAAVKFNDEKLELGVSAVHENITGAEGRLLGTDARVEISENMEIRAEYATTDVDSNVQQRKGDAYRAEFTRDGERTDVNVFLREEEAEFGLGQQSQIGRGTRTYGAETETELDERWTLKGEMSHEDNLDTRAERELIKGGAEYERENWALRGGATIAEDRDQLKKKRRSELLNFGATRELYDDRLRLRADTEWLLNEEDPNADYPNRHIVGADYALTSNIDVFTEHEWTQSRILETRANRAGLRARPWSNAVVNSSLERQSGEFDERTFAAYGLTQNVPLNAHWKASLSYDESRTLEEDVYPQVNPDAPLASGSVMPQTEDFWAATSGLGYQSGLYLFDSRLEYRDSRSDTRTGLFASWQRELDDGIGHALRLQLFSTEMDKGEDQRDGEVRYSTVVRQLGSQWMLFNRFEYKHLEGGVDASGVQSRKWVENLAINYTPDYRWQLAAHLGLKHTTTETGAKDFEAHTWLLGSEARYDLHEHWDVGIQYHRLDTQKLGLTRESWGLSTGFDLARNLWLSVGYNWTGYDDEDFQFNGYTAKGPYLKLRYKFDQNTFNLGGGKQS
ncbi:MAG: OmpA family protein [Pseudomonadota bacterium]